MFRLRLFLLFFLLCARPCFAQVPGDALFSAPVVHEIDIRFSQPGWWDSLTYYKTLNDVNAATIYLAGDVIIDGDTLPDSGVRLKGNASYQHPGRKKSLVLSFNEFVSGQKYDGLKAFHLDNSAYDPTMLREKIYLDLLNRNGLPAPRCAFAHLSYNGSYVGLYKIIESVDKTFLQAHFGNNERNLFKGDPSAPMTWEGSTQSNYYDNFELKTNETANDWSDLVELIDVINNSGTNFQPQIEAHFNVHDYLRAWAANNVFGNLDSYMYLPHNYYLYNDSLAGRFQWISWDVGVVFGVIPTGFTAQSDFDLLYLPDPPQNLPLNNNLLSIPAYKQEYLNDVCYFLGAELKAGSLFSRIDSLAGAIRTSVYAEPDSNRMYTVQQFEANLGYGKVSSWLVFSIPGLKDFITKRSSNVSDQLCGLNWSCALGGSLDNLPADKVISIFPSPAKDQVTVSFAAPESGVEIAYEVTDMAGRKVFSDHAKLAGGVYSRVLDTSRWKAGVYFLRVLAGCRNVERKIVIVR